MHRGQCIADSPSYTCNVLYRHVCTHIESTHSTSAVLAEVLSTQASMSFHLVSNPRKQEMEALVLSQGIVPRRDQLGRVPAEDAASELLMLVGCFQVTFPVEQRVSVWPHPLSEPR